MRPRGRFLVLAGVLFAFAASEATAQDLPRHLDLRLHPDWATLLREIQASPDKWDIRKRLADHYDAAGYSAAARFIRHRPDRDRVPAEAKEPPAWPWPWACPENPASILDIRRAADGIEESVRTGHYAAARDETTSAMKTFGPACQLLVEWARIALLDAVTGKADTGESETAVRILITGIEELNVEPIGLVKPTGLYEFLSQYFCSQHDFVSCLSALDYAIARLESVPPAQAKLYDVDGWRAALMKQRQSTLGRSRSVR